LIPCPDANTTAEAFFLERDDGASLVVAVNHEIGFLNYFPAGYDGTRSFSSIGELEKPGTFEFTFGGEHSEVCKESTVERGRVLLAIADFLSNAGMPRAIAWQRD